MPISKSIQILIIMIYLCEEWINFYLKLEEIQQNFSRTEPSRCCIMRRVNKLIINYFKEITWVVMNVWHLMKLSTETTGFMAGSVAQRS